MRPYPRCSVVDRVLAVDSSRQRRKFSHRLFGHEALGQRMRQQHRAPPLHFLVAKLSRTLKGFPAQFDCLAHATTVESYQSQQVWRACKAWCVVNRSHAVGPQPGNASSTKVHGYPTGVIDGVAHLELVPGLAGRPIAVLEMVKAF